MNAESKGIRDGGVNGRANVLDAMIEAEAACCDDLCSEFFWCPRTWCPFVSVSNISTSSRGKSPKMFGANFS